MLSIEVYYGMPRVGGQMLTVLQSMYSIVKSCVMRPESLADLFECSSGVRQGWGFFIAYFVLDIH